MEFGLEARTTFAKLDFKDQQTMPLRRKAKIFSNKLPQDFFGSRPYPLSERKSQSVAREDIHTQKISRKSPPIQRELSTREACLRVGNMTSRSRCEPQNAWDLILGIITSTREMNRQIKKHSLQLKREGNIIKNPETMGFELPPLKLKKGFSAN